MLSCCYIKVQLPSHILYALACSCNAVLSSINRLVHYAQQSVVFPEFLFEGAKAFLVAGGMPRRDCKTLLLSSPAAMCATMPKECYTKSTPRGLRERRRTKVSSSSEVGNRRNVECLSIPSDGCLLWALCNMHNMYSQCILGTCATNRSSNFCFFTMYCRPQSNEELITLLDTIEAGPNLWQARAASTLCRKVSCKCCKSRF